MNTFRLIPLALGSVVLAVAVASAQQPGDKTEAAAVRAAVEHYFQGHATGDPAHMRIAFLPSAHIEGIRSGAFSSQTLDTYAANFRGRPAPDESSRRRTIDVVDVTGTAAMAKATLVHGATTFTDYFVLLKVDGEWRIANKVYDARR